MRATLQPSLLVVALFAAVACRGRQPAAAPSADPRAESRRERLIDLLADPHAARRSPPEGAPERIVGDWIGSDGDDRVDLLVALGNELAWDEVPIHSAARLAWRVGVPRREPATTPAAFAWRIAFVPADGIRRELASGTIAAQPEARQAGEVDLSAFAGGRGSFVIESASDGSAAPGSAPAFAAWSVLELHSDGREPVARDRDLAWSDFAIDLAAVCSNEAARAGAIELTVPGAIELRVGLAASARLRFFESVVDAAGPIRARVLVDGVVRHSQRIRPGTQPHAVELPLLDLGPGEHGLRFEVEPARVGDPPGGLARFALPCVVATRHVERQRRDTGPDVLFIVIDTLRADALGLYGAPGSAAPCLDRLGASALVFDRAYSPAPWTLPATASLLTGLEPDAHGVTLAPYLPGINVTLAERFAAAGVTTGAFVANTVISRDANFEQGFETFQDLSWGNAGKVVPRVLRWVDDHVDDRLFAYVHLVDPHTPYAAPLPPRARIPTAPSNPFQDASCADIFDRFAERMRRGGAGARIDDELRAAVARLRDLYDEEVRYVDEQVGAVLDALRERGRLDGAIVVITSDHGEEFLEHGGLFHRDQLYDESVRVPLLVRAPGLAPGRIEEPFGTVGLHDLILALARLSSVPAQEALDPARFPPAIVLSTELATELGSEVALRREGVVRGRYKLLATPERDERRLYDLRGDPGERIDLVDRSPDLADALQRLLREQRDEARSRAPYPGATGLPTRDEELRALGYVK